MKKVRELRPSIRQKGVYEDGVIWGRSASDPHKKILFNSEADLEDEDGSLN